MEQISMLKGSRLGGVLRYFTQKVLSVCGVLAACGVIASLISYALIVWYMPNLADGVDSMSLSFLYNANSVALIILCAYAAHGETRYLAITPAPRYSIYIGVLWKIVLFSVLSSAVAALHSVLDVLAAQALNNAGLARINISVYDVDMYRMISTGDGFVEVNTMEAIARLAAEKAVHSAISMIEWGGVWYLYLCLLRRWKMATLAVTIGAPILLVTLLVVPFVTGWVERIAALSEAEIMQTMPLLYDLIELVYQILQWMVEKWPWVRAGIGLGCYALAYPVMRTTPQPN